MTDTVICHSCGHALQTDGATSKRKIRCIECGVYNEIAAVAVPSRRVAPEDEVAPDPLASVLALSIPELSTKRDPIVTCPHCGELVRLRGSACSHCGVEIKLPDKPKKVAKKSSSSAQPLPRPKLIVDETDENAVPAVAGPPQIACPTCHFKLPADAALCTRCGLDMNTGEKAVREYQKIDKHWESSLSLDRRKKIFLICEALVILQTILLAVLRHDWTLFVFPLLTITSLLAFLLGTYDRLDITRTAKGQVRFHKTWRFCFYPRPTKKFIPWEYEGIKSFESHSFRLMDFMMLALLALMGIVPAVIWWFWGMNRTTYYVAMTQHHGFPELYLYHGGSQQQMDEIVQVLQDVTGMPLSRD